MVSFHYGRKYAYLDFPFLKTVSHALTWLVSSMDAKMILQSYGLRFQNRVGATNIRLIWFLSTVDANMFIKLVFAEYCSVFTNILI